MASMTCMSSLCTLLVCTKPRMGDIMLMTKFSAWSAIDRPSVSDMGGAVDDVVQPAMRLYREAYSENKMVTAFSIGVSPNLERYASQSNE